MRGFGMNVATNVIRPRTITSLFDVRWCAVTISKGNGPQIASTQIYKQFDFFFFGFSLSKEWSGNEYYIFLEKPRSMKIRWIDNELQRLFIFIFIN